MKPASHATPCVDICREFADTAWLDDGSAACATRAVEAVVESGAVLVFPQLAFTLAAAEQALLDERIADGKSKNISLRWGPAHPHGQLRGAAGTPATLSALHAMIARFAAHSEALVQRLFPHYADHIRRGNTSFRPQPIEGRESSWRQDDTRLHVDAFPSNPMRGTRLLRVFTNLNPRGQPRVWRVGEPFDAHAARYLPQVKRPLPGAAQVLHALHLTKARRTEYDHVMLQLHDLAKSDLGYQRDAPQQTIAFAPGTTWVVFSDQVLHAAMSGQHMLEQTFLLEPAQLLQPATSPLHTLERLLGRPLVPRDGVARQPSAAH